MASGPTTLADVSTATGDYYFTFIGNLSLDEVEEKLDAIFADNYPGGQPANWAPYVVEALQHSHS